MMSGNMKFMVTLAAALLGVTAFGKKVTVRVEPLVKNAGCEASDKHLQTLYDKIVGYINTSAKYHVVERARLATIQKELELIDAGMTDGEAPESNRIKAAGYCIYGKVVQFRCSVDAAGNDKWLVEGLLELQLQIANIESTSVVAARTVQAKLTDVVSSTIATTRDRESDAFYKLIDEAAKKVVAALNDVVSPVYVLSISKRSVLTANVAEDRVSEGDEWEVFLLGEELVNPETGESLGQDEELLGRAVVTKPGAKTTKFRPKTKSDAVAIVKAWNAAQQSDVKRGKKSRPKMVMREIPAQKVSKSVCSKCNGFGVIVDKCKACSGSGRCPSPACRNGARLVNRLNGGSYYETCRFCRGTVKCLECNAKGSTKTRCVRCNGKGVLTDKK